MKRGHEEVGDDGSCPVQVTGPVSGMVLTGVRLWAALPSAMPGNTHAWYPPDYTPPLEGPPRNHMVVWIDDTRPPEDLFLEVISAECDYNDVKRMQLLFERIVEHAYNYDDRGVYGGDLLDLCVCSADGERALVFALALVRSRVYGYVPSAMVVPEASGALKCGSKLSTGAQALLGNLDREYDDRNYSE